MGSCEKKVKNLQMQHKILKDRYNQLIRRQQKEGYSSPCCGNQQSQQIQQTGKPMTSHITSSFEMAREIRTPYDQYWLKVYNSHSMNENYNLP